MKAYMVRVSLFVSDNIVVHASSDEDAERVASMCARERIRYDVADKNLGDHPIGVDASTVRSARAGERLDTYMCSGCGGAYPKTMFGPGWCKCPKCGAPPVPTVSEVGADE